MGWDITTAQAIGTKVVSGDDADAPTGLYFSPDGTKMYICGTSTDVILRYDLSTAWDVTTASLVQTLSVGATDSAPSDVFLSPDGTKLYLLGGTGDKVHRWNLSTAWSLASAGLVAQSFSIAGEETQPRQMYFRADGLRMYVTGFSSDAVIAYTLSTAWSLAAVSGVTTQTFVDLANGGGVHFSADGTKMVVSELTEDQILRYDLSTAWDVTTASLTSTVSTGKYGRLFFDPDGELMFVAMFSEGSVTAYQLNDPPAAPTLVDPIDNKVIDAALAYTHEWDFEDPNTGDSQTAYDIRYRVQGTSTWTEVSATSTDTFHQFAGGTFTAGNTYEWQVRTTDTGGKVGPYSASEFFDAADQPSTPTIDDPTTDQVIGTEDYDVDWTTATQNAYRVRVVGDAAGAPNTGTVHYDTGVVESSVARSATVPFPTDGVTRHVQVQVRHDGLWSEWASVRVSVSYTTPPTPTVTLLEGSPPSAITVDAEHPAPSGTEPTVTSMDVQRSVSGEGDWTTIAAGLDPAATYVDYAVATDTLYDYRVVARASSNGTSSTSAVATGSVSFCGTWLHDPSDPAGTVHHFAANRKGGSDTVDLDVTRKHYAGRKAPVAEFGEHVDDAVACDIYLRDDDEVDALRALVARKSILLYRDGDRRKMFGIIAQLRIDTRVRGGDARFEVEQADYDEAV